MSSRVTRRSTALVFLLASALAVAGGFAWLGRRSGTPAALVPQAEPPAARVSGQEALVADEVARSGQRQAALPAEERADADLPPGLAGRLVVRAIDAQSGAPIDRLRLRAASETRLADRVSERGSAELQLMLTPGAYTLLALARGYEPLEVPGVQVAAGVTAAVQTLRLREGSARVLGLVRGDPQDLHVELLGDGRRPCALCLDVPTSAHSTLEDRDAAWERAEPCPSCGFAAAATRRPIARDGRFAFERLVSGRYTLRLVDAEERTRGLPRTLELHAGEALALEFEDTQPRTIELELLDCDGSSLAREWAARLRSPAPPEDDDAIELVVEESEGHPVRFECSFRSGELLVARSALVPPRPLDAPPGAYTSIGAGRSFSGRKTGVEVRSGLDDRRRGNSEPLRPESPAPPIEPAHVESHVDSQGLACFERLPPSALVLELASGPFTATVEIPSSAGRTRVRAQLKRPAGEKREMGTLREYEAGTRR